MRFLKHNVQHIFQLLFGVYADLDGFGSEPGIDLGVDWNTG